MCSYQHHHCRICNTEYECSDPDWICPTMNFDENAEICKDCEKEYWESLLAFNKQEEIKLKEND